MKIIKFRNRHLFFVDIFLCNFAYIATIIFVFPLSDFTIYFSGGFSQILLVALIYISVFYSTGIYHTDWINAGSRDYIRLITSCILANIISVFAGFFVSTNVFFLKFNLASTLVVSSLLCILRFFTRLTYKAFLSKSNGNGKRILIVGAGRLAVILLRDIYENDRFDYNVVGLIDDDITKQHQRIYGVKVLGTRDDINKVCKQLHVDEIIFAIYNLDPSQKSKLLNICSETGKRVRILPGVEASLKNINQLELAKDIEIEDLLERSPINLDNNLLSRDICGKTILVTGGSGSIGSELCRQILKFNPAKLIVFDIYENSTFELQGELMKFYPNADIDFIIGSVRDKERLTSVFKTYSPDIVFHAAAHKHVPLMEDSPHEAIKNNVFGTYNTAICARDYGSKRFVLISTDKAVNPTNIMGATKRMCEMIIQTLQQTTTSCEFVAVRFGNVLGSNGSVIPSFKKQIASGGPVTVTHPEITRFFMTIPEAASLVLQATCYAKGGEIFVLDMGNPVKIYDLARKMILLSGLKPDVDIKIKFIGLRPGEKLYEELLMNEEGLEKTSHSKIFVGQPIDISFDELEYKLRLLETALECDNEKVKEILSQAVPTYNPQKN